MKGRMLIVDDERSLLEFLHLLFEEQGYSVDCASSVTAARARLGDADWDVVLCDILMPDGNGLELLREIRAATPSTAVIMMTAYTSTKSAIEAMKEGALNYISKPFDVEELKVVVAGAMERRDIESENVRLRGELADRYHFANIIGRSPKMREIYSLIERVSRTQSTVLLRGESGTGKELIARAVHHSGPRRDLRFLTINCGALPQELLESELFGHVKGSFTGAVRDKNGLFLEADRGTLFLDEIGEMSLPTQVKLLRALQEKKVRPVGGHEERSVDVRIIAATNRDLEAAIREGRFREDLYYRVNVIPISLPPLRHRREDIPLLTHHFLTKYSSQMGVETPSVSDDAMEILEDHDWPGNVRELENAIERALALGAGSPLQPTDLPRSVVTGAGPAAEHSMVLPPGGLDLEAHLDEIRRVLMRQALDRCGSVQTQAAEVLGMSFRSFRYYAKKLGITTSDGS